MKPRSQRARTRGRVNAHRARQRAAGLRTVQFWVTDKRRPGFAVEADRQARRVARSAMAAEDQAFIDAVTDPSAT